MVVLGPEFFTTKYGKVLNGDALAPIGEGLKTMGENMKLKKLLTNGVASEMGT